MTLNPLQKVASVIIGLAVVASVVFVSLKIYEFGFERGVVNGQEIERKAQADATQKRKDDQEKNDEAVGVKIQEKIVYRDRYITKIKKEVEYVAAPLAECVMPDAAVRLWNESSRCILEPSSPGC